MPIQYKMDVLAALKEVGYSSYRLRKEKIMGEATIQAIRTGQQITWDKLSLLCELLGCQPGDIIEYAGEEHPIEKSCRNCRHVCLDKKGHYMEEDCGCADWEPKME